MICSISSLCDSECLQLHSTVKLIFSWSKTTDRWQSARLSEFFWQHSRRRHLVRLLVPASTGFQPNTEHPLFISSLHTRTALARVIHNTASSVPLYMNKLVRAERLLTYFREVCDLNLDPTPTIQTDVFRGLLIPFMWSAETVPGWILRFHRQYKEFYIGSCVNWKPAETPNWTRLDMHPETKSSLQYSQEPATGPYSERPPSVQSKSQYLLKIRFIIILQSFPSLKIKAADPSQSSVTNYQIRRYWKWR